ncbi:MAG TPA: 30S ribosomal protein S6 [Candidatus Limnocylindrales bacterium]|nr:30S ribosomal protein S6 [Candidatus Limnocylindrales bacterium]
MRLYELVLVLRPSVKEADRKKLLGTIKEWLADVKITKENDLGQKPLAYSIKKEVAGHYYQLMLEGESIAKDFETRLVRNEHILRHLMLRTK